MKKFFVCFMMLFILGFGVARAEDSSFGFMWKNDDVSIKSIDGFIKVNGGYLAGGYVNGQDSYVAKFDDKGNEIAHVNLNGDTVVGLHEYGSYYYAIEEDYWQLMVYKLNKNNLSIVSKMTTPLERNGWNYVIEFKEANAYITTIADDEFGGWYNVDTAKNELLVKINFDNWSYDIVPLVENSNGIDYTQFNNLYSKEYQLFIKEVNRQRVPIDVKTNGTYNVVVGRNSEDMTSGGYIAVYDKDNKLVKEYNSAKSTMYYTDVLILGDNILALGPNHNNIDVYGFDAKLIESIELKKQYSDNKVFNGLALVESIGGFTAAYWVCDLRSDGCAENCKQGIMNYEFLYNIEVKTDGNGEIITSKNKEYGNGEVTFKIKPKEGYVLGSVKVTDRNGNVLTFTDYTFTMPYADVLIQATFQLKNPDTYVGYQIFGALIIAVIALIAFVINLKKARELL